MSLVDRADREHRGRRYGRRPGKHTTLRWSVAFLLLLPTVAMSMVWLNVQYTRAFLGYEDARRRNATLLSDLSSYRLKVQQQATLGQLDPRARQELGLSDTRAQDMRLVAFDPALDRALPGEPGLLDQFVPAAVAREGRFPSETSSGRRDARELPPPR
jgi:hypothetical protein